MKIGEMILILDFGSQTTQLIARRIREQKVYCEIHPYSITLDKIKEIFYSIELSREHYVQNK